MEDGLKVPLAEGLTVRDREWGLEYFLSAEGLRAVEVLVCGPEL